MATTQRARRSTEPPARAPAAERVSARIVRPTTVELVVDAIRKKILAGELAPGEPLRQEALADELGVSRVPIREAITRLHAEGMLNVVPHKGAYVCDLSVSEVREAFDIRLRLEPWIFAEAIMRITDAEIEQARSLIEAMGKARESEWGQLNWRFHETLYLPAQRELTIDTLKRLHARVDRYFRFQVVNVPIRALAHDEHLALLETCRKRDAKRGARLLEQHVKTASSQIVTVIDTVLNR
jgi:DNA-binding GntR family transcriptional regulator